MLLGAGENGHLPQGERSTTLLVAGQSIKIGD